MPHEARPVATPPLWTEDQLGVHLLVEFWDCSKLPGDEQPLQQAMVRAAELAGATVVATTFHKFSPVGLSGVVVLAESHLAVHTWPERDAACIDLFSCSPDVSTAAVVNHLREAFGASRVDEQLIPRGAHQPPSWQASHRGPT